VTEYDFTEEAIRDMVELNHRPVEMMYTRQATVECDQCHESWPCPALLSLREWRRETGNLD
jgi:hypothetical protein